MPYNYQGDEVGYEVLSIKIPTRIKLKKLNTPQVGDTLPMTHWAVFFIKLNRFFLSSVYYGIVINYLVIERVFNLHDGVKPNDQELAKWK